MLSKIRSTLRRNVTNALGWRTNRKILVIESDDWGSIRMPSKAVYEQLKKTSIGNSLSLFDSLDSLERKDDFQKMLDLANDFRDFKNRPLIITLNTVMQNPDFARIKDELYHVFYGTPFFQSYRDYYGEELENLWRKGVDDRLIKPQFHAREHLSEFLWMRDLRAELKETRLAFDYGFYGLKTKTSSPLRRHYLAAYFSETKDEFERTIKNTIDGLNTFENTFGFPSRTFIACNYVWPEELEVTLAEQGINSIQSQSGNTVTNFRQGTVHRRGVYTGKRNHLGQVYTVRNVVFEPYLNKNKDWVGSALSEISNAFFWKRPAIMSTHRINFASEMKVDNRDSTLSNLTLLIQKVIKKFPNVEFLSSDELSQIIRHENSHTQQ